MLSRTASKRTKSASILNVIMAAIYSSFLIVFLFADEVLSDSVKNSHKSSQVPSHSDEVQRHKSVFDSTDLFIPLIDTKQLSNSKTSDESFENLKNSKLFQKYQKEKESKSTRREKVHLLSSASASALLSSSTLSVDELPKPQVQKQTPTGATSVLKKKDNTTHHHKHRKHHSKNRHHKVGDYVNIVCTL